MLWLALLTFVVEDHPEVALLVVAAVFAMLLLVVLVCMGRVLG